MQKNIINKSPKFSIIINNYNYETYIGAAIESVLNQTFSDFELIVVDDGSTDNSRAIIASFQDNRIQIVLKENGGQASTLNAGFSMAKGLYVAFLDSDDLFDKDKLERVLDVFTKFDYVLVQHQLRIIDQNGQNTGSLFPTLKKGELDVLPLYFQHRHTNFFSATSGVVASRRILRRIFPLPEAEWKICADAPLTRPLPVFGNVYTLTTPAGSYRVHGHNNWQKTEEQRKQTLTINGKINQYTNSFLRRWGIENQIGIPLPLAWMAMHNIRYVAIYGAGKHTRYLCECQGLPAEISVMAVVDDAPTVDAIADYPVYNTNEFDWLSCDAVLISSEKFETEMIRKSLGLGISKILPLYGPQKFQRNFAGHVQRLVDQLRKNKKKRIALYGDGVHTLNLLLSGLLPTDIEVTCILDDKPAGRAIWNIPVFHPQDKITLSMFDGIVLSSASSEKQLFDKALAYGFESIFLLYSPILALRGYRADLEQVRKQTANERINKVAIYEPCWYTQNLLQSGYLDGVEVVCILAENKTSFNKMCDIPVMMWQEPALPPFDLLIIPPITSHITVQKLDTRFDKKILALPKNPDEIGLLHDFLNKYSTIQVMLDVGANVGSSLKPFAKDGWQIHAFEPDSIHCKALTKGCATFPKVAIHPLALSNTVKEQLPLYRGHVSSGISGLSIFHRSHYFAEYTRTVTLALVVQQQGIFDADFLKIDTEGYDLFVLQGNDWNVFRPRIIMCEFEDHKSIPLGYDFYDISDYLVQQNYHVLISEWDPVIEYGNQLRWRRFMKYPCGLLDPEASGNLFAFREENDLNLFLNHLPPDIYDSY